MKVFISYDAGDNKFMNLLTRELVDIGVVPFIVNLHLILGEDVFNIQKLDSTLQNCKYCFIIISNSYLRSEWHQNEMRALLAKEKSSRNIEVVTIRIDKCEIPEILSRKPLIDFATAGFDVAMRQLARRISSLRHVFVIMKFGDTELDLVYRTAIRPVIEEHKYLPIRVDEIQSSGVITEEIERYLDQSEVVLADLTGERPNCYYEAGYAQAMRKELILTIREGSPIHFDLAANRFITWRSGDELRSKLNDRFRSIKQRFKSSRGGH